MKSIRPTSLPQEITRETYGAAMDEWVTTRLKPYKELILGKHDIAYLINISCLKERKFGSQGLENLFSSGHFEFNFNELKDEKLKEVVVEIWNSGSLHLVDLTPTGQIIGAIASDILSGTRTNFEGWE